MWAFAMVAHAKSDEICDGVDNDEDGLIDEVAASIQGVGYLELSDAVHEAASGDTILVCPGDHQVYALAIAGDLTLKASGGPGTVQLWADGQAFNVEDGGILRLTDLTLRPMFWTQASRAIFLGKGAHLVGTDLAVEGFRTGIWASPLAWVELESSRLIDNDTAARLEDAVADLVDTKIAGSFTGVELYGASTLTGGEFTSCLWPWAADGTGITISDTTVVGGHCGLAGSDVVVSQVKVSAGSVNIALGARALVEDSVISSVWNQGDLELQRTEIGPDADTGLTVIWPGTVRGDGLSRIHDNKRGILVASPLGAPEHGQVTLSGLVVDHNHGTDAGAGIQATGVDLTLEDMTITHNLATVRGGGIDAESVTLRDSLVESNSAPTGGGLSFSGTVRSTCTWWGTGRTDNTVGDVAAAGPLWSGASEDLRCDPTGCIATAQVCGQPGGEVVVGR